MTDIEQQIAAALEAAAEAEAMVGLMPDEAGYWALEAQAATTAAEALKLRLQAAELKAQLK